MIPLVASLVSTPGAVYASEPDDLAVDGDDGWAGSDAPDLPGDGVDAPAPVVGGEQVSGSRWSATVGIVSRGYVVCTGTLIHPKVVLTAGHCAGGITDVLVNSKDWARDDPKAELVEVDETIVHPDFAMPTSGPDIAVLLLADRVTSVAPATIAIECIVDDHLHKKADVEVVGYGITSESGQGFNTKLNHGTTKVQTPGCADDYVGQIRTGCDVSQRPNGEIGAGGTEVDACYGDSGGPLYLITDEGDFLVGVTSRSYLGVDIRYPCRDGGIYTRPDKYFKWIEKVAEVDLGTAACNQAPDLQAEPILTKPGKTGYTDLRVDDPDGDVDRATFEVVEEPDHGAVDIDGAGRVGYTADEGYTGTDRFTVAVTDAGNDAFEHSGDPATVELEIAVEVKRGFFRPSGVEGCGCRVAEGPGAGWVVLGGLALVLGRRRKAAPGER